MFVMVLGQMGCQHFMSWPRIDGGGAYLARSALKQNSTNTILFQLHFHENELLVKRVQTCATFKFSHAQPCVATETSGVQPYTHGCNHRSVLKGSDRH